MSLCHSKHLARQRMSDGLNVLNLNDLLVRELDVTELKLSVFNRFSHV
jgi:hypothetical protein